MTTGPGLLCPNMGRERSSKLVLRGELEQGGCKGEDCCSLFDLTIRFAC